MKKFLFTILTIAITFANINGFTVSASTDDLDTEVSVELNTVTDYSLEYGPQTRSLLGKLTVFVGSVLVGYVIDGIVVYVTGKPGDAWVTQALTDFFRGKRGTINYGGGAFGGGGGGSRTLVFNY